MDSIDAGDTPDNEETRGLVKGLLERTQPKPMPVYDTVNGPEGLFSYQKKSEPAYPANTMIAPVDPATQPKETLHDFGTSLLAGAQESVLQPFVDLPAHLGTKIASAITGKELDPEQTTLGKIAKSVRSDRPKTENPESAVSTIGQMMGQLPEYALAGATAGPAGLAALGTAGGLGSGLSEIDQYHSVVDGVAPTAGQKTAYVLGKGLLGSLMGVGPLGSPGRAMVSTIEKELGQAGLVQLTFAVGDHVLKQQTIDPNAQLDVEGVVKQVGAALLVAGVGHGVGKAMEGAPAEAKPGEISQVKAEPEAVPREHVESKVLQTKDFAPETDEVVPFTPEAVLPTGKLEPTPITEGQRVESVRNERAAAGDVVQPDVRVDAQEQSVLGGVQREATAEAQSQVGEAAPPETPPVIETPSEPVNVPVEKPSPEASFMEDTTGIRNAVTKATVEDLGKEPTSSGAPHKDVALLEAAKKRLEENPHAGQDLVEELRTKPRPTTNEEGFVLGLEWRRRRTALNEALAKTSEAIDKGEDVTELKHQQDMAEARLTDMEPQLKLAGAEAARGFRARGVMLGKDESLAQWVITEKANRGRKLSDQEQADITKLHERLDAAEKAVAELEKGSTPALKSKRGKLLDFFDKQGDEALARLKTRLRSPGANTPLDPEIYADMVKVAAKYIAHGVDAGVKLVEHFGEYVKPHIDDILAKAHEAVGNTAQATTLRRIADLERQNKVLEKRIEENDILAKREKQGPQVERIDELIKERAALNDEILGMREKETRPKELQLKRRIEDVEKKLRENDLKPKAQRMGPDTPEIAALKKRRDDLNSALTAERSKASGDPEVRRLQKQVADLTKRIDTGDIAPKPTRSRSTVDTEEVAALRKQAQEGRDEIARLRREANPPMTAEDRSVQATERATNRLREKTMYEDFSKKERKEPTARMLTARAELERARKAFDQRQMQIKYEQRSPLERYRDTFLRWSRAFVLSSPKIFVKLPAAAAWRLGLMVPREVVGGAISKGFTRLAAKAPIEGGFSPDALGKAYTSTFTKGMKDAYDYARTGRSELEDLFDNKLHMPPEGVEFIGTLHGALKSPVKRASFEYALSKLASDAIRHGLDPNDPLVSMKLGMEAYKWANSQLFLQDNAVVSAYKDALRTLERKGGAAGFAGSTLIQAGLPIVKIPTNIVAEAVDHVIGTVTGSTKLALAYRRGIESLKPEQAEQIMRSLKNGVIGNVALALGWAAYKQISGQYQRGMKDEPGTITIAGVTIPSLLLHHPLIEALMLAATAHKVADKKGKDIDDGALEAFLGLIEEVPFVRETADVSGVFSGEKRLGNLVGERLVPAGVQQAAKWLDDNRKRKPKGLVESVEAGIPGLRKLVHR